MIIKSQVKTPYIGCLQTLYSIQCAQMTRWLWRRCPTRSHSELGRESLQRRWYFVLRHGRVGRCLVFWAHCLRITALLKHFSLYLPCLFFSGVLFFKAAGFFGAGWSSPVARQAHNLKVVGSNPTPATKRIYKSFKYNGAILRDGAFFIVKMITLIALS